MKQWGEWHGDEDDIEYTWEELELLDLLDADYLNDLEWSTTNPPNCSDIGVYVDLEGENHE